MMHIPVLTKSTALGHGSHAHGGAPAQMGQSRAFGNTAEQYRCLVCYGCAQCGLPEHAPSAMTLGLDG
eukprot:scaffold1301_cov135-Isochrysis_galbana.AAC.5